MLRLGLSPGAESRVWPEPDTRSDLIDFDRYGTAEADGPTSAGAKPIE